MTQANGHVPTVQQLEEQTRLARARTDLAQAQHTARLWESFGASSIGFGMDWSTLLNPWGFRYDSFGRPWMPLGMQGLAARRDGRNYPYFSTDQDLDRMRWLAERLTSENDAAIGILSTCQDYTIKKGFQWESKTASGYSGSARADEIARQVQYVVDLNNDLNRQSMRERSAFWRAGRDGEALTRHFAQADGTTRVRFIRAEQLRDPGDRGPLASLGVETEEGDVETPLWYHVTYNGSSYERLCADDVSHYKRNVDEEIKRGVSDFWPSQETFDDVAKLRRNMLKGGALLSAIAWIESFKNTTRDQINQHQAALRDLNVPRIDHPVSGRPVDQQTMLPGTIVRTKDGHSYDAPPLATNTANFVQIADAALRTASVRWRLPEYMATNNGSNNNVALILVVGSPFVNAVECAQDGLGSFFLRWHWIGIRNACRAGLIRADFEQVQALVDLHYTPPEVAVANEQQQAQVDHQDMEAGVMSRPERARRRGLDWDVQQREIREFPPQQPGGQAAQGQGGGNPLAAALGEALDRETADLLLELLEVRAVRKEGEEWESSGRKYKRVGGKTVRVAKEKDAPSPSSPAGRADAGEVGARLKALLGGGPVEAKDVQDVVEAAKSMKVADIQALMKEHGVRGTSGAKAALLERVKAAIEAKVAPSTPAPGPAAPAAAMVEDSVLRHAAAIHGENLRTGGIIKVPDLVDRMVGEHPGMSREQAHQELERLQREGKLTLQLVNDPRLEPRQAEMIKGPRGTLGYVHLRGDSMARGKELLARPAPTPSGAHPHALPTDHPVSQALGKLGVKLTPELLADPEALHQAIRAAIAPKEGEKPGPEPAPKPKLQIGGAG